MNKITGIFDMSDFSALNLSRCNTWHSIDDWSPMEWGAAAAGELGELCNVLKKIKRLDQGIQQEQVDDSREKLVSMAADEIADTLCYLDLVAASLEIDFSNAVINKFNKVSIRENLRHRLYPARPSE